VGIAVREHVGGLVERTTRAMLLTLARRRVVGQVAIRAPGSRNLVSRFVAGESLSEALGTLQILRDHGFRTTVDMLGESAATVDDAREATDGYIELLEALALKGLDRNVSLKLTQFGLDLGREICTENLRLVFARSASLDGFVRVDMEDHARTDSTLRIWRSVRPSCPDSGVVIQAALRRSPMDIDALIEEGAPVRLCKGAYREPATVAFQDRHEIDAAYDALAARLLASGVPVALATHDETRIRHALALVRELNVGRDRFEFQMLYGVRRDLQDRLLAEGWHVRVYVPFGTEWYPYFMRRLAERPANVGFVVRSVIREAGVSRRQRVV
jgi:proline dehydrogenase